MFTDCFCIRYTPFAMDFSSAPGKAKLEPQLVICGIPLAQVLRCVGGVQLSIISLSIKHIPTSCFWNAMIYLEHLVFMCNEFLLVVFRIPEIPGRAKK